MPTLTNTIRLENNLEYICDKCHYLSVHHQAAQPELMESVKEIKSLYDKKLLGEEAYHDLLKFVISIYIANEVSTRISSKLETALSDKLSPHRLLETLA